MESDPEILLAEIPCTSCGYNLNTLPITGRCPECAAPVAQSLQAALTARTESGREVAAFVRDGAWFNVLLLIGAVVVIVALFLNKFAFLCLLLPVLALYAVFQTVAVLKVAAWPEKWLLRHRVIAISGTCFAALPPVVLIGAALGRDSPGLWMICVVLFPAVGIFTWAAGNQYADLCMTNGLDGLRHWCRNLGRFNAGAVALMEIGFVCLWVEATWPTVMGGSPILGMAMPTFVEDVSLIGGLALLLGGTAATAVLQFLLSRHLRHLANKAATITLTGRSVPAPPSSAS